MTGHRFGMTSMARRLDRCPVPCICPLMAHVWQLVQSRIGDPMMCGTQAKRESTRITTVLGTKLDPTFTASKKEVHSGALLP